MTSHSLSPVHSVLVTTFYGALRLMSRWLPDCARLIHCTTVQLMLIKAKVYLPNEKKKSTYVEEPCLPYEKLTCCVAACPSFFYNFPKHCCCNERSCATSCSILSCWRSHKIALSLHWEREMELRLWRVEMQRTNNVMMFCWGVRFVFLLPPFSPFSVLVTGPATTGYLRKYLQINLFVRITVSVQRWQIPRY